MIQVKFYDKAEDSLLKFAVIIARYHGKWVFCKHKERNTYEIPGGHRESNESILETAKRELNEETGATHFQINPICIYSVTGKTRVCNESDIETFGMLFLADIDSLDVNLHSEIEKIVLTDTLVKDWTYPQIQPKFFVEASKRGFIDSVELL